MGPVAHVILQYKADKRWQKCKHLNTIPNQKSGQYRREHLVLVSDIKLIRTDTTL
jgi:hypothetical protein